MNDSSNEKINKPEFITEVVSKTGFKKKDVERILEAMLDTIIQNVNENKKVSFIGFGAFMASERKDRIGVDNTGKDIIVPARIHPKFTAGQIFKDALNGKPISKKKRIVKVEQKDLFTL